MKFSYEVTKAFIPFTLIGLLMIALFIITNTQKVSAATSTTSADYPLFLFNPNSRTQTQIQGAFSRTIIMPNTGQTATCENLNHAALYTFTENTTRIGSVSDYTYYYTSESWGVTYPETGTMSSVLSKPALYDVNCWVNAPEVEWRDSN